MENKGKANEKDVVRLLATNPLTFEQVGDIFGVSKQYIHQIYQKAGRTKRYPIISVKKHRITLCDTCQRLVKLLNQYDIVTRNALEKKLGIPRKQITFHLARIKEARLIPTTVLFFSSDRLANAFVHYKQTDIPIYRIGITYGYKNFHAGISYFGRNGVDISRHPNQGVKALLTRKRV